jgi:ribosomal protein S18 acetylase RimI-like enzyme
MYASINSIETSAAVHRISAVESKPAPDASLTVEELPAERLDELAPLWDALRVHHLSVATDDWLPEPRSAADSWHRRRANYEAWLAGGDAFVLLVRRAGLAIGYAAVQMRGSSPTWKLAERGAELETLSVLPDERGRGVGQALLAAVHERLRARGGSELSLHVLAGNDDARRFYEREGFRPFALWMIQP